MATPCKTLDLGGSTFYSEFNIVEVQKNHNVIPSPKTTQRIET